LIFLSIMREVNILAKQNIHVVEKKFF